MEYAASDQIHIFRGRERVYEIVLALSYLVVAECISTAFLSSLFHQHPRGKGQNIPKIRHQLSWLVRLEPDSSDGDCFPPRSIRDLLRRADAAAQGVACAGLHLYEAETSRKVERKKNPGTALLPTLTSTMMPTLLSHCTSPFSSRLVGPASLHS